MFNNDKYGAGGALTEKLHFTISGCMNISTPICSGTNVLILFFNFFKGWRNDKTLTQAWTNCAPDADRRRSGEQKLSIKKVNFWKLKKWVKIVKTGKK